MAHKTVKVIARKPTLLTDANVTEVTLQVRSPSGVLIQATNGVTNNVTVDGAIEILASEGRAPFVLEEMFPGVAGANRLYAVSPVDGEVVVSYA